MYKIAISGKAGSGKDTISKLLVKQLRKANGTNDYIYSENYMKVQYVAFADPIKEIARTMFPLLPEIAFTGPSKNRSMPIPGAQKNGQALTVRQLLIDIGTNGRNYDSNIWLNDFKYSFNKSLLSQNNIFVVTDVRFRNEFDLLKKLGFYKIRVFRESSDKIDDPSETNQDGINDGEFDYVLNNSGTLSELNQEVAKIVVLLKGA